MSLGHYLRNFKLDHRFLNVPKILAVLVLIALLSASSAVAETKSTEAEAWYTMGDGETPSFAEAMVLQKAKQMALEQAGTYVQSYTHMRNFDLTVDEIKTVAGGLLRTEIVERYRTLEGQGIRFGVKIKATVTTDKMEELAQRVRGGQLSSDYKRLQEDYAKLFGILEDLKKQVASSATESERVVAIEKIRNVERNFQDIRSTEAALNRRLLSGDELSAKIDKALRDQQKRKGEEQERREVQSRALEDFLRILRLNGHTITIGSPEPQVGEDASANVHLGFMVAVEASSEAKAGIRKLRMAYRGNDLPERESWRIEETLTMLTLIVTVTLKDGTEYSVKRQGVHNYRSPRSWDLDQIIQENPTRAFVSVEVPSRFVREVTSVDARVTLAP